MRAGGQRGGGGQEDDGPREGYWVNVFEMASNPRVENLAKRGERKFVLIISIFVVTYSRNLLFVLGKLN